METTPHQAVGARLAPAARDLRAAGTTAYGRMNRTSSTQSVPPTGKPFPALK
jgi:hypothetical protein